MKNKKTILLIIGILLGISFLAGISYAYYIKSHSQEENNVVKTKCLNFSLTNEKNDIKLDEQYPIPDSEGRKLTPYQFTITNTCEQFISYNVNLESLEATTMDSSAVKVMINNEAPVNLSTLESTSVSIDSSKDSKILATGSLGSNDSVDYALRLWMDYGDTADTSSMNKVFESKVVVTATVGTYKPSDYVTTLHDAILVNEYGVTDVNNAISRIEAKGTPDFSQTAPIVKYEASQTNEESTEIVSKASKSILNTDDTTSNLQENDTLMTLFKNYDFNEDTGMYTMKDPVILDPTTIDWTDKTNNYYYEFETLYYNPSTKKIESLVYKSQYNDIFKVTGATKTSGKKAVLSNSYDTIDYNLKLTKLSQNEIESNKSDKGLYMMQDDFGKSYYFRGNINNNNVMLAGYNWKIVRINGDGSIRLLYNGESSSNNDYIKKDYFSTDPLSPTNTYYYYNGNDSYIKKNIDLWYISNLSKYSGLLSDSGFCGDKSLNSGDGISNDKASNYVSRSRLMNSIPSLNCSNKETNLYTISTSNYGNKMLTYPIGLISLDELMLAGLNRNNLNRLTWAHSNSNYFTMTPSYYNQYECGYVMAYDASGIISFGRCTKYQEGMRPVINLKSNVEISGGIGTVNDPYIVKTN